MWRLQMWENRVRCPRLRYVTRDTVPDKVDDAALTFGVVSHPLRALESTVRAVYGPILNDRDNRMWGKASADTVHEFLASLDGFVDKLQVPCGGEGVRRSTDPDPPECYPWVGYRNHRAMTRRHPACFWTILGDVVCVNLPRFSPFYPLRPSLFRLIFDFFCRLGRLFPSLVLDRSLTRS